MLLLGAGEPAARHRKVTVWARVQERSGLKAVAEVDASVTPLMPAAQLYMSGMDYSFNVHRMPFNRVTNCRLVSDYNSYELEDDKRGIYGGAVGYLDFTGNLDTCIAIRIAYKKNGKVFVRSGAGIVADSVPEKEYQECINKAAAVINALKSIGEVE